MSGGRERGQASVELLGGLPALLVLGFALFQLLAVGYAAALAGNAAEAGALALAAGRSPQAGARDAVPGWQRAGMTVSSGRGTVLVTLHPPSPLRAVGRRLAVRARAEVDGT